VATTAEPVGPVEIPAPSWYNGKKQGATLTTIDDILARLSKNTSDKYRIAKEISKETVPTASLGLNMLLDGGVGIGKQSTFWGNESAGKSAFWLQSIGINQALGRGCAYIDVEKTFDKDWAARLGVNTDELLVSQVSSIPEYTDLAIDFIKAGVEIIVVDSTSALMPKSFFEEGVLKEFDKTGQIGQFAKELGQSARMIQGENFTCAMIHISQVRMDLQGFKPGQKPSGGKEVGHADSLRVKLLSSKADDNSIKDKLSVGGQLTEVQIGRKVKWGIDKNKQNGRYGVDFYDLYFRGDFVGIDRAGEVLDYGQRCGVVSRGGSWYTIGEERFQGRDKAIKYLRENDEAALKLEAEILGQPF
jgi:recombination protein RecA